MKHLAIWTLAVVLSLAANACVDDGGGGGGGSSERDMCARFDQCNLLPAGVSVDECNEAVLECTGDLLPSQYTDWKIMIDGCLSYSSCQAFFDCWSEVPSC